MSVCDPMDAGVDICPAVGGDSTADHTECYVGIDDHAEHGGLDLGGCGMGCAACTDYPSEIIAHMQHEGGTRWLRPLAAGPNRDANGMLHDLRSGEAHPVGEQMVYERAPCYRQDTTLGAEECFARQPCRCWRGGSVIPGELSGRCPGGEDVGQVVTSEHFADSFGYAGWDWPMYSPGDIHCRRFQEFQAARVLANPLKVEGMLTPVFLRYGQYALREVTGYAVACAANGFIPCLASPRPNPGQDCIGYYLNSPSEWPYPDPPTHWLNDRAQFNELWITENTAQFEPSILSNPMDKLGIDLKNRALDRVRVTVFNDGSPNGVRFDRVDLSADAFDGASQWRRSFNLPNQHCDVLTHPETLLGVFPDCRLAEGGDRVEMRWNVLSVAITVLLVSQKYFAGERDGVRVWDRIEYHARAKIDIQTAWRGSSETAEIVNHADCGRLPESPGDRIVWRDGDRVFRPPQRIIWLGYLGRLGANGTLRTPIWVGDTIEGHCRAVARGVRSNPLDGWPVLGLNAPAKPSGHYAGRLKVEFPE